MEKENSGEEYYDEEVPEKLNEVDQFSLDQRFAEATKDDQEIKSSYAKLMTHKDLRYSDLTSPFNGSKVAGYMKKCKNKTSFFKKDLVKRFFFLDFNLQTLFVSEDQNEMANRKSISFHNILSCTPCFEIKKQKSKTFNKPFMLETRGRFFELYTPSEDEREMWMAAFDYVIKSTRVVVRI